MTDQEAAAKIRELSEKYDTKLAHVYADEHVANLLEMLGYPETAREFDCMNKWYA